MANPLHRDIPPGPHSPFGINSVTAQASWYWHMTDGALKAILLQAAVTCRHRPSRELKHFIKTVASWRRITKIWTTEHETT